MGHFYKQTADMLMRDHVYPIYVQPNWKAMESASDSDIDSDDSLDDSSDYTSVDTQWLLNQSIAVWTYSIPDRLSLFTLRPDDTFFHLIRYAQQRLDFNADKEKMMVMEAGEKSPRDIKDDYTCKAGSVVMIKPKRHLHLLVEVNQLNAKFPMSADTLSTVHEVKAYIKRVKGVSIDQQDILYRDKPLENSRRLFEYKVKNNAVLHVLIQVHFDLIINVETFWGKSYRLYVDRCSTGSDLIYTVFGRTFSRTGPEHVTIHELYVPVHVLTLQHKNRSIHWDYCLGYFGLKNGDTLILSTVGKQSKLALQMINVVSELGENFAITVSHFDRWSVVAFILHGLTDVPVDQIRLFKERVQLDFTSIIGEVPRKTAIVMNVVMTTVDEDLMYGVPLRIGLGNGIVENIKIAPGKKIRDVKSRLEHIGVPNASLYELTVSEFKLPHNGVIQDVIRDLQKPLFLKVERFPVFLHAPDGIVYKTMVDVNNTVKTLKRKIELKSGHAISSCRLIMSGQEITLKDSAILYDNGFSSRSSVFVEHSAFVEVFNITIGDILVKLKIPLRPHSEDIKRNIWNCREIPEGAIACLQTFCFWFFHPRVSRKYTQTRRRKNRKVLPAVEVPLAEISDRKARDKHEAEIRQLEEELLKYNKFAINRPVGILKHIDALEETKSWPPLAKMHVRPERNVEEWIKSIHNDQREHGSLPDRIKRRHTYREPRKLRERDMGHNDAQQRKAAAGPEHIQPRWMGHLYDKNDENRLVTMDADGLVYKQRPVKGEKAFLRKRPGRKEGPKKGLGLHEQGDATTGKFLQRKLQYDKQDLMFTDSDGSVDEGIFMRPQANPLRG